MEHTVTRQSPFFHQYIKELKYSIFCKFHQYLHLGSLKCSIYLFQRHNPHFLKSEHKTKLSFVYPVLVIKVLLTTENKTYASKVKNPGLYRVGKRKGEEKSVGRQNNIPH